MSKAKCLHDLALRKADLENQAYELLRRGQEVASYLHLVDLIAEYVELRTD